MKVKYPLLLALMFLFIYGCADIKRPTPHYAVSHPLSTKTMVSLGTTKEEVLEKWGEPSEIIELGEDDLGLKKEAWIYEAWIRQVPLDYRHLSRKKKIYFTGNYVTGFEDIEGEEGIEGQ